MLGLFCIGAGGTVGASARYLLGRIINARLQSAFPWATWLINISGSFLLGYIAQRTNFGKDNPLLWKLIGTGFCGAFTTFSTFGYETLQMIEKGKWGLALRYVVSSIVLAICGVWIGIQMAHH